MPENFIQPVTDRQVCFKCQKTVTGKRKLSKCSKCHAITYCGKQCQVADWARHAWNCVPVMVTEIEGKGRGLVAARDIKMGEFIFLDKPAIKLPNHSPLESDTGLSEEEFDSIMKQVKNLSSEAKRHFYSLEEKKKGKEEIEKRGSITNKELGIFSKNATGDQKNMALFLNCALLNHSCAPNAAVEPTEDQNNEVRAIKDISKGEEVTIFYKCFDCNTYTKIGWKGNERMKVIKDILGFDCKCCVCAGNVPGQEEILKDLVQLSEIFKFWCHTLDEKQDLSDLVKTADKIVDLSLRLYVGHIEDKTWALMMLAKLGFKIRDEVRLGKAKRELMKLAEETKLKFVMRRYRDMITKFPHA